MYWLGVFAIILVQGSLLPKVYSLYKYGAHNEPVSFYVTLFAGLLLFEIYAWHIGDPIYIVSNLVGMTNAGVALWLIGRFGR